jgi:hypothetical protein
MKDLDKLTMDELHGILTAYEMRTEKENPSKKEASFKASKKMKNKEHKSSDCSSCESDAEEAHFVRKLKKGSGKYKGKFPFKCFNCGKVGHFVAKCPYAKDESSDDEEDHNIKKGRKHHQHKKNHKQDKHEKKKNSYKQKKSLYSKGVSDSSEESSESSFDSDREETLFMEIETKIDEDKGKEMMDSKEEENVETNGEVDLEEELMCALREIKNLRKKNLKQKE